MHLSVSWEMEGEKRVDWGMAERGGRGLCCEMRLGFPDGRSRSGSSNRFGIGVRWWARVVGGKECVGLSWVAMWDHRSVLVLAIYILLVENSDLGVGPMTSITHIATGYREDRSSLVPSVRSHAAVRKAPMGT
ncbi:hypothetical protein DFP72DRAFT_855169 [Ephemerocybe angulata]|uniref:Uncharacterized protein n=1 Tax=Ephemerocybe angulata TaxID=980116 RepID=A0A8H6LXP7_9AGAR|nr:hypothetical protein DFP72DRAFT_855169 [Tulosesus angulatus]